MKTLAKILLIPAIALFFSSCGKDGEQGPQGNANVTSGIAIVANWTWDANHGYYYASVTVPEIAQNIVDGGVVMVYLYANGINTALPWTYYPSTDYSETLSFDYSLHEVLLYVEDSDHQQPVYPGSLTFRIVTIAPAYAKAHPGTDWKDYRSVEHAMAE